MSRRGYKQTFCSGRLALRPTPLSGLEHTAMDADLLTKFAPVFYFERDEAIGPCTFETYAAGCSLLDTEHGVKLAEPGRWSLADHADAKNFAMNFEMAPLRPENCRSVPIYATCSTVREGSKAYYSLLYICLFPVGQPLKGDEDSLGRQWCDIAHVRVYVDHQTGKVAKICFPGYANSGGWILPEQATWGDTDRKHAAVYVGIGTHSMNPRAGVVWRAGGTQFNDSARGSGLRWAPKPVALPAFLSAWKGALGKGVATPQQSPWFYKEEHKTGDDLLARTIAA